MLLLRCRISVSVVKSLALRAFNSTGGAASGGSFCSSSVPSTLSVHTQHGARRAWLTTTIGKADATSFTGEMLLACELTRENFGAVRRP